MSEQDMENLDSSDELDHDLISTDMLEDIRIVNLICAWLRMVRIPNIPDTLQGE